ncbi:MAG TPA: type VI secretion system baseplate subunit TssK [Pseudacidobacterium sp.]|jgi:hypothetical protein|nr:type VI secretion system baseplate subunit TssK [Pseudacidobacterium sp.]
MDSIHLRSVNWEHGMLLTPEHFLRLEQYFESLFHWGMRYMTTGHGLLGGGTRLPAPDLGAVRLDPIVYLDESAEALNISVSQCRGLTSTGFFVDVDESGTISERFDKESLAGVAEAEIYVVLDPSQRIKIDGAADEFNPQMRSERASSYRIALKVTAAERERALAVARIQRPASGAHFEKDAAFIPPCMTLSAHSELMAGWRRIVDAIHRLSQGYAELHRAMREFMVLFTERGIETELDRDAIQFAERMVLAFEEIAYSMLDRTQSPQTFFIQVRKLLHQAATFFDLAPNMQQYYETLRETGETELVSLVEGQRRHLDVTRTLKLADDLSLEVRSALQSLTALEKLERALEGKYIDFRISPSLDGMNFIFDRGGKVLYKLAAKPSRVQGIADELTIYFSQLRLEGRDRYRLILLGERDAPFVRGTSISVEIRLNEGTGFRREAIILSADAKLDEQYNFEFDFEAPDVPTITDVRVTVQAYHPIRTALLFSRHRFYAGRAQEQPPVRNLEPDYGSSRSNPPVSGAAGISAQTEVSAPVTNGRSTAAKSVDTAAGEKAEEVLPPWVPREREKRPAASPDESLNRPRRRRLE